MFSTSYGIVDKMTNKTNEHYNIAGGHKLNRYSMLWKHDRGSRLKVREVYLEQVRSELGLEG